VRYCRSQCRFQFEDILLHGKDIHDKDAKLPNEI